jgi:hypothetical protein
MSVHMFPRSDDRSQTTWPFGRPFPDDLPVLAVQTNVFPQLGLLTKVYPRFVYGLYLLPLRQL